jgi:hypothetical protein
MAALFCNSERRLSAGSDSSLAIDSGEASSSSGEDTALSPALTVV